MTAAPAPRSVVFATYWRFAAERQRMYERRLAGRPAPWTADPILYTYRFTNTYRAADRVSQYLIREVISSGDQATDEVVLRILLFKIFNRIQTWELLEREFGTISTSSFDVARADQLLAETRAGGQAIYTSAYIMPSLAGVAGVKHRGHLRLIAAMLEDGLPGQIHNSASLEEVYGRLRAYPGMGPFLAYHLAIDINYSAVTDHDEDDFVVVGPGALDGIAKACPGTPPRQAADLIRRLTEEQEVWLAHYGLTFAGLFGRRLHLIDVQNLFCEVGKYSRVAHPEVAGVAGRQQIKQSFRPAGSLPRPCFPPKWRLVVPEGPGDVPARSQPARAAQQLGLRL